MKERGKLIVTVGGQRDNGDNGTGARLVRELGIHFYGKDILRMNSGQSGIRESYYYLTDEEARNKLLYKVIKSPTSGKGSPPFDSDLVSTGNLFRFQPEVVQKLATGESCVIMGYRADYVLEDTEGLVRVFLYTDMEYQEKRIGNLGYYEPGDIRKNVRRIDRERRDYHQYCTGHDWKNAESYDLMPNMASSGAEGAMETICAYLRIKECEL